MGLQWSRDQFLAGAAICVPAMLTLIPSSWLDSHPNVRWVVVAITFFIAIGMLVGAFFAAHSALRESYISALDAMEYVATESLWGVMGSFNAAYDGNNSDQITTYIRLAALEDFGLKAPENHIRAIGIVKGHGGHTAIEPTYWYNARIEWDIFLESHICKSHGIGKMAFGSVPEYTDIKICKEDLFRTWPKPPPWWWG